eukprot:NODE_590_length_5625_cov_0.852515.p5 type:complete len:222 gc:universal NODE_590_length_5625_cov_0.852515:5395-4730(-)
MQNLSKLDQGKFFTMLLLIVILIAQVKVGCSNPRIRKEIRSLSKPEWQKVKKVFNVMKERGIMRKYSEMHSKFFSRFHNNMYFLYWHREFLYNFENEMIKIDKTVTLPYWNWAKDSDKLKWNFDKNNLFTDEYLGTVDRNGCVKGGVFEYNTVGYPFKHCISRRYRKDILPSGTSTIASIIATPYGIEYFSKLLENGPHVLLHMHFGGDMGVSYSTFNLFR